MLISARYISGLYDIAAINSEISEAFEGIPYNTYGAGQGIQMIYHELEWDNHAKYRDISSLYIVDCDGKNSKDFITEILSHDSFVVSQDMEIVPGWIWEMVEKRGYTIKKDFSVGIYPYYYMTKE